MGVGEGTVEPLKKREEQIRDMLTVQSNEVSEKPVDSMMLQFKTMLMHVV